MGKIINMNIQEVGLKRGIYQKSGKFNIIKEHVLVLIAQRFHQFYCLFPHPSFVKVVNNLQVQAFLDITKTFKLLIHFL